jgi:hypothetical protein
LDWTDPPGGKVGEVVSGLVAGPKSILEQDLQNFKDIMEGNKTPQEIQEEADAAKAHAGIVAFLASGPGLLLLGSIVLLVLLLRRGGSSSRRRRNNATRRITFEF